METENTLNGFTAILDRLTPNVGLDDSDIQFEGLSEELTDEELEALKNKGKADNKNKNTDTDSNDKDDNSEGDDKQNDDPDGKGKGDDKKKTKVKEKEEDNDDDDTSTNVGDDISGDNSEVTLVGSFFDALSEKLGWEDVTEDEKPKSTEELIDYFSKVIEENSIPNYASEEVEKLDAFVRNGGDIRKYFSIDAELDLENIDLEDDESAQKAVLKEFMKEKGFSSAQIEKKLSKYEDAGILEDEAEDALEALRDIRTQKKEQLLTQQKKAAEEAQKRQQDLFNNVVAEIKGMDSIYGIEIPEKDKKTLLEYIFKPGADGMTKYQKDYAKSLKNLITSAYFTMKGDTLVDLAKKKGQRAALDNFKNALTKNQGVNKTSTRRVTTDNDTSLWASFTKHLRAV